jgi:hypothetical protein
MSRPLAAIRSAQVTDTPGGTQREESAKSMSPVEQLAKLADMYYSHRFTLSVRLPAVL